MKKLILSIVLALTLFITPASAEFFPDIIVTSPNGIWTDSRAYETLNDAISVVGANERTIKIVSPQTVTALTIPSNVTLEFARDGAIVNSGQLTINTRNIRAPDRQIFTGAGDVDFADGSVVRSAWFPSLYKAINLTNDDSITLLVTSQAHITTTCVLGNDVTLKWDSPNNIIQVDSGVVFSNIKNIEAGNYQIFAGLGDYDFLDGTILKVDWFNSLRSAAVQVESEEVTLVISKSTSIDFDTTTAENLNYRILKGGYLNIDAGVTLTVNGYIDVGKYDYKSGLGTLVYAGGVSESYLYPSYLAADQGVIGNSDTVKYYVDTIGTDSGTIYFKHNSGGATTTYTFSTDETIPSNIKVVIEKGAILSIDAGITLTIDGPFDAGFYQVFSGDGSVVGLGRVNAMWFGAIADSSTDNAVAFTKAAAAVNAQTGSTFWIPESDLYYDFSTGFSITANDANLICDGELRYTGTSGVAITLGREILTFHLKADIKLHKKDLDWTETCTGVRLIGLRAPRIALHKVYGFTYGVEFNGAGGSYYGNYFLTDISDNKIGLYFNGDSGTMNGNNFYGGKFYDSELGGANYAGSYGIYIPYDDTWAISGNTFYSPRFEAHTSGLIQNYIYCAGESNTFIHPRFEDACSDIQCKFVTGSSKNVIVANADGWVWDQTKLNSIFSSAGYVKQGRVTIRSYSVYNTNYISWNKGDRWLNYDMATGESPGKICTVAGSYLPAPGITATTTNGVATIDVSDASKVPTGFWIEIAGVTGPHQITTRDLINDQYVIDPAPDATVAGAAVTIYNPTFVDENPILFSDYQIYDAPSIADGASLARDITVVGAELGDWAFVAPALDILDISISATVTAADTVTMVLTNNTGGAVDLPSMVYRVRVQKT